MDWSASPQATGLTPSTINGASIDDPSGENVTFTYTGPVIASSGTELVFGVFSIISTQETSIEGNFSSQATKNTIDASGTTDQLVGRITVPSPAPEPGTVVLLGTGIAGLVLFGRTKRG
jgi:hypothetical protein